MPTIAYDSYVPWANYHLTTGTCPEDMLEPQVKVEKLGRFHAADVGAIDGIERFAATARTLWSHIQKVLEQMVEKAVFGELGNPPSPFPATFVGRGWSFSHIIGADVGKDRESMLLCDGLAGSILVKDHELAAKTDSARIVLTAGGTRLRELLEWSATLPQPRSIMTSGTHLGMTVAGAIGTASHGSRLGFGGIQNMVVGMHVITGLGDAVWIERASRPVLTADAIDRLDPLKRKGAVRVIRDDAKFEDALVHLGCMGIVNCVALETVDDVAYDVFRRDMPIDLPWLDLVAAGKWDEIAALLGEKRRPVFYELTLNPHDWSGHSALHQMYFETAGAPSADFVGGVALADAVASFGKTFAAELAEDWTEENTKSLTEFLDLPLAEDAGDDVQEFDLRPIEVPIRIFDPRSSAKSVYEFYRDIGNFKAGGAIVKSGPWRSIHEDEITGGAPGSLYNASYAVKLQDVPKAVPLLAKAVSKLPMSFVFTLRFVSNPAGTMAFTRFPQCAVIEIDGLSPWICQRAKLRLPRRSATRRDDIDLLKALRLVLPRGNSKLQQTLADAGIDFSNHFAKRGFLDRNKISHDFSRPEAGGPRLARWRRTRDELLAAPHAKAIFWHWGAVNFGLLDAPAWPADVELPH